MAYAALASILHITDQFLNPDDAHARSIPCTKKKMESLNQTVLSLLALLESCSSRTVPKSLESRIRDSAYKAEDILESHTANYFLQLHEDIGNKKKISSMKKAAMDEIASVERDLKKLLDEILSMEEGLKIENINHQDDGEMTMPTPAARRGESVFTVGLNEALKEQIMEELVGRHGSGLEIIAIVGMGGIGKTTLARNLFDNQTIVDRFDIRVWVTISQEYRVKDVFRNLVREIELCLDEERDVRKEMGDYVYKSLYGRRYLIVLDDVWSVKAWDDVKKLFPMSTGNRIMLTTRHVEVAVSLSSYHHELNLLDEDTSWNLLCQALFGGEQYCPPKLVKFGKNISKNCRGLPLAIVVVVGLLSKKKTQGYWEYIADNVSSILATSDEQYCLEVLSLSYKYLPQNLKACFLYMGVFPEDYAISVSKLIKLWVAEGFLKPVKSRSFEEIAEDSLKDLIDRNLIMVVKKGSNGRPKTCNIHDLLREICIREAKQENFLYVLNRYVRFDPNEANKQRRLSIHPSVIEDEDTSSSSSSDDDDSDDDSSCSRKNGVEVLFDVMNSMPRTRSFVSPASYPSNKSKFNFGSKLLRVMDFEKDSDLFPEEVVELVNIRYLALDHLLGLPSSICKLWNLQTLIASCLAGEDLPPEIWDMTQLRHLKVGNCYLLADTRDKKHSHHVLKNLQTLSGVMNFVCRKKVLAGFPNLRRLKITFDDPKTSKWSKKYHLRNLVLLTQLQSLSFLFDGVVPNETLVKKLTLPISLKKLTLRGCRIPWEHMTIIGVLPNLRVLKLQKEAFRGPDWETEEGEFLQLEFLMIEKPVDLVEWRVESTHFPRLQHLVLKECSLEEIPSDIGDIATLDIIELYDCSSAVETSAKEIQENCDIIKVVVHPRTITRNERSLSSSSSSSSSFSSSSSSSSGGSECT